jgi:hypothetical protein
MSNNSFLHSLSQLCVYMWSNSNTFFFNFWRKNRNFSLTLISSKCDDRCTINRKTLGGGGSAERMQRNKLRQSCPSVRHENVWRSRGIVTLILSAGLCGCKWPTLLPGLFIPGGKNPHYPLKRRLGESNTRSICSGREKTFVAAGNQITIVQTFGQ